MCVNKYIYSGIDGIIYLLVLRDCVVIKIYAVSILSRLCDSAFGVWRALC